MTNHDLHQLRSEAEQHRQAIATDVDLVTDRVVPARIADRQKARVQQRLASTRDSIFGTPDRDRPPSSDHNDEASIRDRAGDKMSELRSHAPESVESFTEGNALAAGMIGLGLGLLAASLIPSTDEEQRIAETAQDTLESGAEQVAQAGAATVEALKPAAEGAVADVKDSAQDSVDSIKGEANDAARSVQDSAHAKADEVRP